jgi:hypothetical protein
MVESVFDERVKVGQLMLIWRIPTDMAGAVGSPIVASGGDHGPGGTTTAFLWVVVGSPSVASRGNTGKGGTITASLWVVV